MPYNRWRSGQSSAIWGLTAVLAISGTATNVAVGSANSRQTAYVHANLIDTRQGKLLQDVAIVVAGGSVASVTPMNRYRGGPGIRTMDLKGQFVLPGLINSHVHLATSAVPKTARAYLRRELMSGVTAVRDMAGDARLLSELKREAEFDEIPAPDIYYSALFAGPEFFVDPRTHEASRGRIGSTCWSGRTPQFSRQSRAKLRKPAST